jgi:hypothetical protein
MNKRFPSALYVVGLLFLLSTGCTNSSKPVPPPYVPDNVDMRLAFDLPQSRISDHLYLRWTSRWILHLSNTKSRGSSEEFRNWVRERNIGTQIRLTYPDIDEFSLMDVVALLRSDGLSDHAYELFANPSNKESSLYACDIKMGKIAGEAGYDTFEGICHMWFWDWQEDRRKGNTTSFSKYLTDVDAD